MAKALKIVAIAAAVVAVAATGGAALGVFAGIGTLAAGGVAISAATIASIASVVSTAASIGAAALAKPPPTRGSVTQVNVSADPPQPYVMGEGYFAGILRADMAWGAEIKKVPNPYRFMAIVYSGCGPVESISPRVDFDTVPAYYSGFLYTDTQLGACPEGSALAPQWGGAPDWGASHKLSGQAAIGWSFLFDKDGKVFTSGLPVIGAYGQWVKVYDPRLDSTQPGGSGSHRIDDETTFEWSENPALHAATYAYGRYQNGQRVFGVGMPADGIDWLNVMAWANVCDTNGWTMFGVIYEPDDRWDNLKDICFAGGASPVPGAILSFKYDAPVVALDTISFTDLTDDMASVVAMQSFRDRVNTVVPKYRSADHNWEMIDAEAVVNSTFLTDDGEERKISWSFNFVKNKDQAAQLAAYRLFNSREVGPIKLVVQPRLRIYRPGDCLYLDIPELGLDTDAIILSRQIDPTTMKVTLELIGETPAKHAYCLGQTGVAPPTPSIGLTGQERDEIATGATGTRWDDVLNAAGEPTGATVATTITTGGVINTDAVITDSIIANAVSDTAFAFTSGGVLLGTSYGNVQSLAITADGTTPINLSFGLAFYWSTDNARGEFALYRDTTPLVVFDAITISTNENPTASGFFSDVPAAGTYTYYLKALANDNLEIGVKNRYIFQTELKR